MVWLTERSEPLFRLLERCSRLLLGLRLGWFALFWRCGVRQRRLRRHDVRQCICRSATERRRE